MSGTNFPPSAGKLYLEMQLTSFEIHPLYWVKGRNLIYVRDRFPGGSDSKEPACNVGDLGLIPGSGRSPGEGNCYPFHILAWKIPWTEESGRLQSVRS